MGLPNEPVVLTVEQVAELNRKLADMRHAINNNLALIVAAAEVIRYKPENALRVLSTFNEQSQQVSQSIRDFSTHFELALHISRE